MALGGKRPGAGRKKGSLNKKTLEQKIVAEAMRQRVLRSAETMMNAHMALAQGLTFLYVIKTITVGKRKQRLKPKLITSQATIEAYLAGELDNGVDEYYFMSTQKPDGGALNSLWERGLGKVPQPIAGDPDNPIVLEHITGMRIAKS